MLPFSQNTFCLCCSTISFTPLSIISSVSSPSTDPNALALGRQREKRENEVIKQRGREGETRKIKPKECYHYVRNKSIQHTCHATASFAISLPENPSIISDILWNFCSHSTSVGSGMCLEMENQFNHQLHHTMMLYVIAMVIIKTCWLL